MGSLDALRTRALRDAARATQGDQSGLDMRDRYRLGIQGMDDYAQQLYQIRFCRS